MIETQSIIDLGYHALGFPKLIENVLRSPALSQSPAPPNLSASLIFSLEMMASMAMLYNEARDI